MRRSFQQGVHEVGSGIEIIRDIMHRKKEKKKKRRGLWCVWFVLSWRSLQSWFNFLELATGYEMLLVHSHPKFLSKFMIDFK